jgi:hypothetical protein
MSIYGGPGVGNGVRGQPTTAYALEAGAAYLVPSGWWQFEGGPYCSLQEMDTRLGIWVPIGNDSCSPLGSSSRYIHSDGVNFRIVNQSGCVIGALLTNAGSGYTSAPTVTDATTGATYQAIVGGAVNTTVTVTNGGSNYTYPPFVQIQSPANPGIQATGYCTLSAGAVTSVTIFDQGAGYIMPPQISFINDPREGLNGTTIGSGASAITTLTGSQTVTGVLVLDHGKPVTSLPTLSFSGGGGSSAAATAVMCWAITAYAVTSGGAGYSGEVEVTALGGFPGTSPAYTNVMTQSKLLRPRRASILAALSGGAITATGQVVYDGGIYAGVPTALVQSTTPPTTAASLTLTMGGVQDFFRLLPA